MELFAGLSFLTPWALAGLAVLPVLWWLLRVTPPAPKRIIFPAIRLLFGLRPKEETPHRTPWWLILMRLVLASLLILGLAHPVIDRQPVVAETQPLLLVIDNGWSAASNWQRQHDAVLTAIDRASRNGRMVWLLLTAPVSDDQGNFHAELSGPLTTDNARAAVAALEPRAWPSDRGAALKVLGAAKELPKTMEILWISDGVADRTATTDDARDDSDFAQFLLDHGAVSILQPTAAQTPLLLLPAKDDNGKLTLTINRAHGESARRIALSGLGEEGRVILHEMIDLPAGQATVSKTLDVPAELRNRLIRLGIDGQESAGAVLLLDERDRRRPVGLVTLNPSLDTQPFLGEIYYLERALQPFADLHRGGVTELLRRPLSLIVLPDGAGIERSDQEKLTQWIKRGGMVVRFAGPVLAQSPDDLVPVQLRAGDRQLGGVLTWGQPAHLNPFSPDTPFYGLAIPGDVTVSRQVLAEPALDLGDHTWARLSDGTPLVTATRQGEGWLVLVHTTGNTEWTNLPISGLFVEMLQRLLDKSLGGVAADTAEILPPLQALDGYGHLGPVPVGAQAVDFAQLDKIAIDPHHVPGLYGKEGAARALNLSERIDKLAPLSVPAGVRELTLDTGSSFDVKRFLLLAALALFTIDMMVALWLRGLLKTRGSATAALAAFLVAMTAVPFSYESAKADPLEDLARETLSQLKLGYVLTGVPQVDAVSQAGMRGLTAFVAQKTAAEPGEPFAVDVERDDIGFFPLLYWPITDGQAPLSETALRRVNDYLKRGGIILFDTQSPTGGSGGDWLQQTGKGLDIPALTPLPADHVLTKSFYLLRRFPGRWDTGTIWVETTPATVNDGVSSVIIGGNDWAGAWAVDPYGQPMFNLAPGGEAQREQAYRFGVNLVMYALTGNYKADQVHVPAILERLGQ